MSYKDGKTNPFDDDSSTTTAAVHAGIYGTGSVPDSGRVVARPTPIEEIMPSPDQPRRIVPTQLRSVYGVKPHQTGNILGSWKLLVKDATRVNIDLRKAITGEEQLPDLEEDTPAFVRSLVDLIGLAKDIRTSGLQNPITIYERDGQKFILTGERRWLAYHMLATYVSKPDYAKIPARVVDYDARAQVTENTQRRDLTAVGLARCYAIMVMELYRQQGREFVPYAECANDHAYYAQVAEMQVPYGTSKEVMAALNVTTRKSLQFYRDVLKLDERQWMKADEEEWSLRGIMDIVNPPKPENVKHVSHLPESVEHVGQSEPDGGRWRKLGDQVRGMAERFGGAGDDPQYVTPERARELAESWHQEVDGDNPNIPSADPLPASPGAGGGESPPTLPDVYEDDLFDDAAVHGGEVEDGEYGGIPVTDQEYVVQSEVVFKLLSLLIDVTGNTDTDRLLHWFVNLHLYEVQEIDEDSLEEELSAIKSAVNGELAKLLIALEATLDGARAMQRGEMGGS